MAGILIAVDPGACSGWARFIDGKYHSSGHLRSDSTKGAVELGSVMIDAFILGVHLMVIEDQHPGKYRDARGQLHDVSYQTLIAIGRRRGQWEQEALKLGMKIISLQPSQWQKTLRIHGCRMTRDSLKGVAIDKAKSITGRFDPHFDSNEADAICICQYYITEKGK